MKIIQITDTHLCPPGGRIHGLDPEARLRLVLEDVTRKHADAELIVLTGDLCDRGEPEAYAALRDLLAPVKSALRLLPGNHDSRPAFLEAFPSVATDNNGFVQSWLDTPFGRLLFLDSHAPGIAGGRYCAARLDWLRSALAGAGDQPVTVFVHHPPMDPGIAHFDRIGLHDGAAVMELLNGHAPGVRHVVFGHIHMPLTGITAGGIPYSSGQSTAHQFVTEPDNPVPDWTEGRPGYRILDLGPHGLRLYGVEVGQPVVAASRPCAGP